MWARRAAVLLCALLQLCASRAHSGAGRTAFLITTHHPTPEMLARWCALAGLAKAKNERVPIMVRIHPGPGHMGKNHTVLYISGAPALR